jgi:hypothetical protein
VRAVGERANALLLMTFKALRKASLDPWRIGKSSRQPSYSRTSTTTAPHDNVQ